VRSSRGRLKLVAFALLVAAAATGGRAAPTAGAGAPAVRPSQVLAVLLGPHRLLSAPAGSPSGATLPAFTPITGAQTVLPVTAQITTADGARWLQIMVPGRPNGLRGWITEGGTVLTVTKWHIVVRAASRRVLVFRDGVRIRSFAAIVGKPSTPTPHGEFFIEESVRMLPDSAGAPFALALSARSDVLQQFDGGPGQVAIHGLRNLGGTPGTAVSHGCVRLADEAIGWLVAHVGPGVPVSIR
jgi:lipoprotein-anchoring transpeptidase ErfK/SrfK